MSDPRLRPGTNHCKCSGCGEYFTGDTAFRMHRRLGPEGRFCLHPSRVETKEGIGLLRLNDKGLWGSTRLFHGSK